MRDVMAGKGNKTSKSQMAIFQIANWTPLQLNNEELNQESN